jgi:hypothetical protein
MSEELQHGDWNSLKETITESKAKQEQFVLARTSDIPVHMICDQTVIKMSERHATFVSCQLVQH